MQISVLQGVARAAKPTAVKAIAACTEPAGQRLRRIVFGCLAGLLVCGGSARAGNPPVSDFLSVNGVRVHFLVQGEGAPVVLIHGWYSSAALNWVDPGIMAALAGSHRVIALDLPGYGRSDRPKASDAYGAHWIEDIDRLLDHLAVRKAHVVGYSMGGMVALKFVVDHPERVKSVALGGMGYMKQGGALQKVWAAMKEPSSRGVSQLALTADQVRTVGAPVEILIGSRDSMRKLYVDPLLAVRNDWPVVEIEGADHITCILKSQFRDELAKWLDRNS